MLEETPASSTYNLNPGWEERQPRAEAQAEASQDQVKESAKRKATGSDIVQEGEKPASRSRKSRGAEDKRESSKETPRNSEKKKKETLRSKQASGHKNKAPTSKGAYYLNQDPGQELEVEVVGECEQTQWSRWSA